MPLMEIVNLPDVKVEDNHYTRDNKKYLVKDLIQIAKGLEPFDLPLIGIDIGTNPWTDCSMISDIASHVKRVLEVDTSYPVILDNTGFVCDGWHRIVRAIIDKQPTIKAVRLNIMPEPYNI